MLQRFCNYAITNKKSGNALDLSGVDRVSIVGYPYHGRDNQRWTAKPMDDPWPSMRMSSMPGNIFWAIFNEASGDYLNYDGEHDDEPRDGVKMIGSTSQKFFVVVPAGEDHGPDHFRIILQERPLFVTLSGDDYSDPVELRDETGGDDQIWKFQKI